MPNKHIIISFIVLFMTVGGVYDLFSQCAYDQVVDIPDNSSTQIEIVVDGIINDDLASENCLTTVKLAFKHQVIQDVVMTLTSPAGQEVTLVGPEVIAGQSDFVQWDVSFVDDSFIPLEPDLDLDPVWNNDQTWIQFFTYVGEYFPHQGKLEDFNQGSTNGEWILTVRDGFEDFVGEVRRVELIFCDSDGISCQTCTQGQHTINENDIIACEGDPNLDIQITPQFEDGFDDSVYGYGYTLFQDDEYISFLDSLDFRDWAPSTYTVCGVQYFDQDSLEIVNWTGSESQNQITAAYANAGLCGTISEECLTIEIIATPIVIAKDTSICIGESIMINGDIYDETGEYEITTVQEPCDSLSFLNLTVIEAEVVLEASDPSFSCGIEYVGIHAFNSSIPTGAMYSWSTVDGEFVSSSSPDSITISTSGTYVLEVQIDNCFFEDSITILEDDDFNVVIVQNQTITCTRDSAYVDLMSVDSIVNINWTGTGDFNVQDEDIIVTSPGLYMYTLETIFGCIDSGEVEIVDVSVSPFFTIDDEEITCNQSSAVLMANESNVLNSVLQWIGPNGAYGNGLSQTTTDPGEYWLIATSPEGCVDSFSAMVFDNVVHVDADILGDTIDCDNPSVQLTYTSSQDLEVIWTLPSDDSRVDSILFVDTPGEYNIYLENPEGCTFDSTLNVVVDSLFPSVQITAGSFLCNQDSIQIFAQGDNEDISYVWSGPGTFSSTVFNPFIFSTGEYIVTGCLPNGCCASDTITVESDNDIPELEFTYSNLDCRTDTTYIIPSDTSMFDFVWEFNGNPLSTGTTIPEVVNPGEYTVTVTDEINGCNAQYSFDLIRDTLNSLVSIDAEPLSCDNEFVLIQVDTFIAVENYIWSGPGLMDNNLSPSVNTVGQYVIDYTLVNGCQGSDTVDIALLGEFPQLDGEDATITCANTSVTLSVTFESSTALVNWEGPNISQEGTQITASEPGIYTAFAVGPGNCRDTLVLEVFTDTISPVLDIIKDGDLTCSDSIVVLSLSLDNSVVESSLSGPGILTNNGSTAEIDQAGIYTLSGQSANGCSTEETIEVLNSVGFPSYTVSLDSLTCIQDNVDVGISSNDDQLIVQWEGPIQIPDNTFEFNTEDAGVYTFTITNEFDCAVTDSFTVFRDTFIPDGIIVKSNDITCDLFSSSLSIENLDPTWVLTWTGPGVIDPSAPIQMTNIVGEYEVHILGQNGCDITLTDTIAYDTIPSNIQIIGEDITCSSSRSQLSVESDLEIISYTWSGEDFASSSESPLVSKEGIYEVVVVAPNGCVSSDTILIRDERVFPFIEVNDFFLPCDEQPAEVFYESISEGATAKWFGPNNFFAVGDTAYMIEEGEYVALAVNDEGCTFTDTFNIIDQEVLPEFDLETDILLCFGPSELRAIDVEDDRSFSWSGPNGFMSLDNPSFADEPGVYELTVVSSNGCEDSKTIELLDGRIYPVANISQNTSLQCLNKEIDLSAEGSSEGNNFTYEWSTDDGFILFGFNSKNIRINGEGTYILNVTDIQTGCVTSDTLLVREEEQSFAGIEVDANRPTCLGFGDGSIDITSFIGGFPPYEIYVDGNYYGERLNIPYLTSGDHEVMIIDSFDCVIDTIITLTENEFLNVDFPEDTTIIFGETIVLSPEVNITLDSIASVIWSSNAFCEGCFSQEITPSDNLTITIQMEDLNGCIVEDEIRINVTRPENLPFPQIFSPNGDNVNDVFFMPMTKGIDRIAKLSILNTWGEVIFEQTDIETGDESLGWDGRFLGKDAEQGVYVVLAQVLLGDGTLVNYTGGLTLIR